MADLPYISPELVEAYQREISAQASPATAKRKEASLKKFFGWAKNEGHLPQNPIESLKPPQVEAPPRKSSTLLKFGILTALVILIFLLVGKVRIPIPFRLAPAEGPTASLFPTTNPTPTTTEITPTPAKAGLFEEVDPLFSKIYKDGVLTLEGLSPTLQAIGGLLIQAQSLVLSTENNTDGDITIAPDGTGIAHFLFEGTGENFLNAQAPNLTSGSLYYGIVANNATGYNLIKLQSGSIPTTRFSVDGLGNTYVGANLTIGNDLVIGNAVRFTHLGRLASITGYYQDSGNFEIAQGGPDYFKIQKAVSATADSATIKLDETGKTASGYDTLVLSRLNGSSDAYALLVDDGNARFDGQLQLGRFGSNPSAIGEGSLIFNTTDSKVYVWDGTTWNQVGSGVVSFDNITSGTNTSAAMVVGTGASLTYSDTGTITASDLTCIDCLDFTELSDSLTLDGSTDIALGALTLSTSGTGALNFASTGQVTFAGNVAVNGGNITSTGGLNITPSGAFVAGATTQTTTLQGSTLDLTSTGAGNDITLTAADELIFDDGTTTTTIPFTSASTDLLTPTNAVIDAINEAYNAAIGASGGVWTRDSGTGTIYPTTLSDKVGIGTTTPADIISKLFVTGNATLTGKAVAIFDQTEDEDILTASSGGTPVLTLTNAGNLQFHQASTITTTTGNLTVDSAGTFVISDATDLNNYLDLDYSGSNDAANIAQAGAGKALVVNQQSISTSDYSLAFDGNDEVQVSDNASIRLAASDFTIRGFVYLNSAPSSTTRIIVEKSGTAYDRKWWFGINTSRQLVFGNHGDSSFTYTSTGAVPLTTWTHVQVSIDETGNTVYFAIGGSIESQSHTGTFNIPSQYDGVFRIGYDDSGKTPSLEHFDGNIDELEVSDTVRNTSSFSVPTDPYTADANTQALWHFNDGSGTNLADSSGNGNDGTLSSSPNDPAWDNGYFTAGGASGNIALEVDQGGNTTALYINKSGTGPGPLISLMNSGTGNDISGTGGSWSIDSSGNITTSGDAAINGGNITSTGALAVTPTTTLTLNSTGDLTLDSSTDIILDADGADILLKDGGTTFATLSNTSTDLTVDIVGGNLNLADGNVINIGGVTGALTYNTIASDTDVKDEAAIAADNDLYIGGDLEVDGTIYGTVTAANMAWSGLTSPTANLTLDHTANGQYTTSMDWTATGALNPWTMNLTNNGASATTQNFVTINNAVADSFTDTNTENLLLLQQLDTTTLGMTVVDNALKIDSAANSGITDAIEITNSAGNITNGINLVDAAGTFTTGVNFSGTFTNEISLRNAETIANATDGTITLGADSGAISLSLSGTAATLSNTAGDLTLDSGSNTLVIAASDTTLTASGIATIDLAGTVAIDTTVYDLGGGSATTIETPSANANLTVRANGTGTLTLDTGGAGTVTVGAAGVETINLTTDNDSAADINVTGGTTFNDEVTLSLAATEALAVNNTTQGAADLVSVNPTWTADNSADALAITTTYNVDGETSTVYGLNLVNADNGASTGNIDALAHFANANAAETLADGLIIEQTGAGTLNNGLRIAETAGAITTGVNIGSGVATAISLQNAETIDNTTNGTIALARVDSGALTLSLSSDISSSITTTTGDLTIDSAGNHVLNSDSFNSGGAAAQIYNFFATSTAGASAAMDSITDLYVEGDLEVDGTIYGAIVGTVPWNEIDNPTGDLTLSMAAWNTTFNWVPVADTAETNFSLTTQGNDTVAGGEVDQVLLALSQTSNSADVDQAADALLTFANNDANDPVTNAIRFDAGAAGTDFTYGINFDAADVGTEIVLENAETVANQSDGTIALGADSGAVTLSLSGTAATISNTAGNLTIDSAANTVLADATVQLTGGTTVTFDLFNASTTNLSILNSTVGVVANVGIEGDLTVTSGDITGANDETIDIGEADPGTITFAGVGETNNGVINFDLETNAYPTINTGADTALGLDADLTFIGAQTISTSDGTDLTIGTNDVNFTATGGSTGNADVDIDGYLQVGGTAELDGALQADGAATFNSTATFNGTSTFNTDVDMTFAATENLAITSAVTTDVAVNPVDIKLTHTVADSTNQYALFIQNADDAAAASGTIESLITLENNDANESVANGILFTAGGANAPDFVTGINFDAADFTTEIVLENAETIANQTDGTITLGANSGAINLSLSGTAASITNTAGILTLEPASGSNLNITLATTGDLAVNSNDLYVDTATGNTGIGTATPTLAILQVAGMVGNTVAMFGSDGQGIAVMRDWPGVGFNNYYSSGDKAINTGYGASASLNQTVGALVFSTAASVVGQGTAQTMVERLRLGQSEAVFNDGSVDMDLRVESDGNANILFVDGGANAVGIDTGAPVTSLTVGNYQSASQVGLTVQNGSPVLTGTEIIRMSSTNALAYPTAAGLTIYNDDTTASNRVPAIAFGRRANTTYATAIAAIDAIDMGQGQDANWRQGALAFHTADNSTTALKERVRIDNAGNVGIGDTSPAATLTVGNGDKFQVAGATGNITTAGDLAVNGGDITTTSTTFNIDVANTGTINFRDGTNTLAAVKDQGDYVFWNLKGKTDTGNPATCAEGDIYYNAFDDTVYVCHSGNTWEQLDGGGVGTSWWTESAGLLYPINETLDIAVGGTATASAVFSVNASTGRLQAAGAAASVAYSRFGTATSGHSGSISTSSDLLISGDLELNGNLYLDSRQIANSDVSGTVMLILSSDTAQVESTLTGSNWLIENPAAGNVANAALIVNQARVGDIFTASASGATRFTIANNGNVTIAGSGTMLTVGSGAGKIDVGTVDPVYNIGGVKYATYLSGMVGIKEEATGLAQTSQYVPGVGYLYSVDFASLAEGSDLWLFGKATDIKDNIDKLIVLLSPSDNTKVWYDVDTARYRLNIYSSQPTTISYRLTAPRFDYALWTNYNDNPNSGGFLIEDDQIAVNDNGEISPDPTLSLANYQLEETNGGYELKTAAGQLVGGFEALANFIAANIKAGAIETKTLAADNLSSFQATVDNLIINSGLVSPVVKTKIISPLADESDIKVKIGNENLDSGFGKLIVENASGSAVAEIDTEGNATFEGTVSSSSLSTSDATISGTLYADDIKSTTLDDIQNLLHQVESDQNLLTQASTWDISSATDSANLNELAVDNLYVTQQAAINSLSVSSSLAIGADFVIQSSTRNSQPITEINTLTSPLSLQSLALAPIELMAGKLRIETNGDVSISGNLYVDGSIESSSLKLKAQNSKLGEGGFGKLLSITGLDGNEVVSIDASGSANFSSLATQKLVIAGAETAPTPPDINGQIETNATAGVAVIPAGVSEITIKNPQISDYTLVYVTPTSTTQNNVLYLKSKAAGYFVVGFSEALPIDVTFNWWVIDVSQ